MKPHDRIACEWMSAEDASSVQRAHEELAKAESALKRLAASARAEQREALRRALPETVAWLKADGHPLKGERGELALAALAELTGHIKPWETP